MKNSGLKDKNGNDILIGNEVLLDGYRFDVIINDFSKEIVVDGETGQELLSKVHSLCEVIAS